jgi:glycosyltransferase involved in cell wall biosynthesis
MTRILFLWDADAFGGHDVSALVALERLAGLPEFRVGALHTGRNVRLAGELARIASQGGRLEIVQARPASCLSESLDALMRGPRTRSLETVIDQWRPDWAINVQGFITLGLCALRACRARRIPVLSFLPMTHRIWTLRPSPVSLLQDLVNRYWYAVPASFIVTSDRMKRNLVRKNGVQDARVTVVEYGPDLSRLQLRDRREARRRLALPDALLVGIIGRIEFRQKRQDFLIKAVARYREELAGSYFVLVGDGPDLEKALGLAGGLGVLEMIRFLPWQNDMADVYSAIDAVLIPSRFEGVPLVMLEAMARRIPVLASAVDGMADFLPAECLFNSGDAASMVARLRALPEVPSPDTLARLQSLTATRLNAGIFADRFVREIVRLPHGRPA